MRSAPNNRLAPRQNPSRPADRLSVAARMAPTSSKTWRRSRCSASLCRSRNSSSAVTKASAIGARSPPGGPALSGPAIPIASSPRRSAFCTSGSSIAAGVPSRAESSGILRSASGTNVGDGRENASGYESCFGRGRHPGIGRLRIETISRHRLHGAGSRVVLEQQRRDAGGRREHALMQLGQDLRQRRRPGEQGRKRPRRGLGGSVPGPRRSVGLRRPPGGSRLPTLRCGDSGSREARQAGHSTSSAFDDQRVSLVNIRES